MSDMADPEENGPLAPASLSAGYSASLEASGKGGGAEDEAMSALLRRRFEDPARKGGPAAFGAAAVSWMRELFCKAAAFPDAAAATAGDPRLRSYFVTLNNEPEQEIRKNLDDYFGGEDKAFRACIEGHLIPAFAEHLKKAVVENARQTGMEEGEIDWDNAIAGFVDKGLFLKLLHEFQEAEGIEFLGEEQGAKIFYLAFKNHFDSRGGLGFVEMIEVGEKHPEELERMRLMEEYDDIRAALLRLQLLGKISSVNYR